MNNEVVSGSEAFPEWPSPPRCQIPRSRGFLETALAEMLNLKKEEEIAEALGVAVAVNAGATLVYSTRATEAAKEYPREVGATGSGATASATN